MDVKEVISELRKLGFDDPEEIMCCLVYVASREIGPNIQKINQVLGSYTRKDILSKVSWRLRGSGIWRAGRVYSEVDQADKHNAIAFVLECLAAIGKVETSYKNKFIWEKYSLFHKYSGERG